LGREVSATANQLFKGTAIHLSQSIAIGLGHDARLLQQSLKLSFDGKRYRYRRF
jgi:hypothetical protein